MLFCLEHLLLICYDATLLSLLNLLGLCLMFLILVELPTPKCKERVDEKYSFFSAFTYVYIFDNIA